MTLLLVAMVILSLIIALTSLRRRQDKLMQGMAFAAVMAIIAEAIMLTTDFHLQAPANAIYFLMILVIAWKSKYLKSESHHRDTEHTEVNSLQLR